MGSRAGIWWKRAPFVKLLVALVTGILLQWYFPITALAGWTALLSGSIALYVFFFIPLFNRFSYSFLTGVSVAVLFVSLGALLALQKDIRNNNHWLGHYYRKGNAVVVSLAEPQAEKAKTYKAVADVRYVVQNGSPAAAKGRILLYFRKDSSQGLPGSWIRLIAPGSIILFKKSLQEIKNSGNPGGFDYKTYSLFNGITHQVFLQQGEWEILPGKKMSRLKQFIFKTREQVLSILRKNIPGEKERGLAEALLIGYKNDLDQSLVQSYTNTGVVHIIAISGLHIGLIYWLLSVLLKPLDKKSRIKWLRPLLIIAGLWVFSFLAGAQPSVLRSALMFSFIVLGETLSRKTSVYNSLAVSAFLLLCINPYWLWDVGFQLSYAAVLSIIIFMRPVYNLIYCRNKFLDLVWKMNAVTLAAQVLTLPLSIYHFHQFPLLFLLTNFLAVPLSSMILLAEIMLCAISFYPEGALLTGQIISWLIGMMNRFVENAEQIPGSLWQGLQLSVSQSILLNVFIAGTSCWLLERSKQGLVAGLIALTGCITLRSLSFIESNQQQKIVVYNIPQKRAIDFINGRNYFFKGDSDLLSRGFDRDFHLEPSRTLLRIRPVSDLIGFVQNDEYIDFMGKKILLIDRNISFAPAAVKQTVDLLIISKNPRIYFRELAAALVIRQVVFDGSNPSWKVNYWKKDCDSLQINWHDAATKGAFVMRFR